MGLATENEPRSSMIVFYMKKKGGRDPKLCGKSDDNFSSDLELEYTHTQKHKSMLIIANFSQYTHSEE